MVFLGVPLLRWYLAHEGFSLVFHCYISISRTLGFFGCSIVMLVSRARLDFFGVPLLCWYLAHTWFFLVFHRYVGILSTSGFFLVFHCYVGISRTLGFS